MLRIRTMDFAPDTVKVLEVVAALPSFAVIIITHMVSVMVDKLRLPGMANDDAASATDYKLIGTNSTQYPDSSHPGRHE